MIAPPPLAAPVAPVALTALAAPVARVAAAPPVVDVLVIGAGPAGSAAAHAAARAGASVLLVDKGVFPRDKVCGCCVNAEAVRLVAAMDASDALADTGAVPLERVELRAAGRSATLPTAGLAVSRAALDAALARAAVAAGASFRDGTIATIGPADGAARVVTLRAPGGDSVVRAGGVIVATGLGPARGGRRRATARVGVGAVLPAASACAPRGVVTMACAGGGYVGSVGLEDGRLDVAGALSPRLIRDSGGAARAVIGILERAGVPLPDGVGDARWRGTPLLTQAPAVVAAPRLLRAGDAAGSAEPFTGEGIEWALRGGRAAGELAAETSRDGRDPAAAWPARHRRLLVRHHARCRVVTVVLRSPVAIRAGIGLLRRWPALASPILGGASP